MVEGNRFAAARPRVPTLFRFLFVVAVLAGIAFAAIFALATFVEPVPREMTVTIPNSKLVQPR
jgi:hypothetical protein